MHTAVIHTVIWHHTVISHPLQITNQSHHSGGTPVFISTGQSLTTHSEFWEPRCDKKLVVGARHVSVVSLRSLN